MSWLQYAWLPVTVMLLVVLPFTTLGYRALKWIAAGYAFFTVMTLAAYCHAKPMWDVHTKHAMARVLVAETGWGTVTERAAVAHVLVKRYETIRRTRPTTLLKVIRAYCSLYKRDPRQPWALHLPWGVLRWNPGFPSAWRWQDFVKPWDDVRKFVVDFSEGKIPDPLPEAVHFGAASNHPYFMSKTSGFRRITRPVRSIATEGTVVLYNYFYERS